jgi:6-phosphogluconolactonase
MSLRARYHCVAAAILASACGSPTPGPSSPSPTPTAIPTPTPVVAPEAPGFFVYVAARTRKTISGFGAGRSRGALTPLVDAPIALSGEPFAMAVTGDTRFAYVGMSGGPDALAAYTINRQTGALRTVPGSGKPAPTVAGDHGPLAARRILLHPSGRLAYVAFTYVTKMCADETALYAYAVDSSTGVFSALSLPPVSVGEGWAPASLGLLASGARLYSANQGNFENTSCYKEPQFRGFTVDASSGALRELPGSPFARGDRYGYYQWLGVKPAGDFLYLARQLDTLRFKLDPNTGAAKSQGASPVALTGVAVFSPAGRLYVAAGESLAWGIKAFDIRSDTGEMVAIQGSPFTTPGPVKAIAIDSSGRFLYAAQPWNGTLSAFAIDAGSGALSAVPGSPAAIEVEPSDDIALVTADALAQ